MNTALLCLLGFAAWTLTLVVVGIGAFRVISVITGKARANQFPAETPHGPEMYRRVMRAHMNCVENLPIFAAVVLTGAVSGYDAPSFGTLATVVLAARIGQSAMHIASGRSKIINIRFAFFGVQLVCIAAMGVGVAGHLM